MLLLIILLFRQMGSCMRLGVLVIRVCGFGISRMVVCVWVLVLFLEYKSTFLVHPEPVIRVSWKFSMQSDRRNVLMTHCEDGDVRLWMESLMNTYLRFSIMYCVEGDPTMYVNWLKLPMRATSSLEAVDPYFDMETDHQHVFTTDISITVYDGCDGIMHLKYLY